MRKQTGLVSFVALGAAVFVSGQAWAVGPRTFDLDTMEKMSGGDLKGVSLAGDGTVRAGWTLSNVPMSGGVASLCALPMADGSVLVGTGYDGKILRVAQGVSSVFADTKEMAVWSLAMDARGTVYAGTSADEQSTGGPVAGKIFKVAQGSATVYATIPDARYVYALAFDASKTTLYAGVGPSGARVFRVQPGEASQLVFKADDQNMVSVAVAPNGDLYAGSSPKGLLYKIPSPGTATAGSGQVLYDFSADDVKAIAFGGGFVYAISNEYPEPPEPPRRPQGAPGQRPAGPTTGGPRPKPGKGTLTRFDAQGRPERLMHHDEFHYTTLAVDPQTGAPLVGTGAEGKVFTVDDAHNVSLVANVDERQIGVVGFAGGKPFIATTDPAVFHAVIGVGGRDAVWTSKVLDAGLRARFGHISWRSTGALEISTRSGDTSQPDGTWSAWSAPIAAQGGPITSPAGRFVQVRAAWSRDPNAVLGEVIVPFETQNVRAIVTEVKASQPGTRGTSEGMTASGGAPAKHETTVKVTWKVDNPDQDPLRYRVWFRREGETTWRDMLKPDEVLTEKTEYSWDTAALPEGKYRIRVEASDEPANPIDQIMKHALESAPVLVDNTAPQLTLQMAGRRLRAHALDGLGPIMRIEVAIDGRLEWHPLPASDGLYDTRDESVDIDLAALMPAGPGSHIVTVRAYDAAGNAVVEETESQ